MKHRLCCPPTILVAVFLLFSTTTRTTTTTAQPDATQSCESHSSNCVVCLENPSQCIFSLGLCFSACLDDDGATCYTNSDEDAIGVCDAVRSDIAVCQAETSCSDCVAAIKSDGSTCQWYTSANACFGGGEGPFGAGSTTCEVDATTPPVVDEATDPPTLSPSVNCNILLDCDACVLADCAWAVGACMDSCDMIADTSCYSFAAMMDSGSAEEICDIQRDEVADAAACATPTDCASCTGTALPSNPDAATCLWVAETQVCQAVACDMNGLCGVAECPAEEAPTAAPSVAESVSCVGFNDCTSCLEAGDICAWMEATQECADSCMLMGDEDMQTKQAANSFLGCFSSVTFPDSSLDQICAAADQAGADRVLCDAPMDCASCLETLKSDGEACQWYSDESTGIQWCGIGECEGGGAVCGMTSCPAEGGVTESPAEGGGTTNTTAAPTETDAGAEPSHPCYAFDVYGSDGCIPCLSDENECAWILGTCEPSCDNVANAQCFQAALFPNATVEEICLSAVETGTDQADVALCGSKNYCFTCTSTVTSDGISTCAWYKDETSGNEWCGTGGCDENGICGNPDEAICQVDTGISTEPPPDSTAAPDGGTSETGETTPAPNSKAFSSGIATAAILFLGSLLLNTLF